MRALGQQRLRVRNQGRAKILPMCCLGAQKGPFGEGYQDLCVYRGDCGQTIVRAQGAMCTLERVGVIDS